MDLSACAFLLKHLAAMEPTAANLNEASWLADAQRSAQEEKGLPRQADTCADSGTEETN